MAHVVSVLKFLADLPPISRWLWFGLWILAGFVLFVASPWLVPKAKETQSEEPHAQTVQQNVSAGAPTATTDSQASQQAVSAPVQIEKLSQSAGGDIQNSVGNTVNEQKTITGGVHYWFIGGTNTIQVGRDFSVKERSVQIQTDEGGKAQIKIYMLYDSAAWSYGSSSKLITHTNRSANLADFLDSPEFSRDVRMVAKKGGRHVPPPAAARNASERDIKLAISEIGLWKRHSPKFP
ncbi:MAG: hypothetical protein WBX25_22075 [Rhodomicrobium sp.]